MKLLDRRRKNYIKKEEKEWLTKCLILNEWIPKNIRLFYFLETPWNAKITEIRNFCLIQKKKDLFHVHFLFRDMLIKD